MFGLRIKHSILVEVNFPTLTAGATYLFPDVPELRQAGTRVEAIQALSATYLATSPAQKTVIVAAGLTSLVATFAVGAANTEELQQYPLYDLQPSNVSGNIRMFNDKQINLSKSYVKMLSVSNLTATYSVLFNFIYYRAR
jgi:hypothetical protein